MSARRKITKAEDARDADARTEIGEPKCRHNTCVPEYALIFPLLACDQIEIVYRPLNVLIVVLWLCITSVCRVAQCNATVTVSSEHVGQCRTSTVSSLVTV